MAPLNSALQMSVSTPSRDILIVDQGIHSWRFKIAKSGTFLIFDKEPDKIRENREHQQIRRVKYD